MKRVGFIISVVLLMSCASSKPSAETNTETVGEAKRDTTLTSVSQKGAPKKEVNKAVSKEIPPKQLKKGKETKLIDQKQ
jgi:hypothetical protein